VSLSGWTGFGASPFAAEKPDLRPSQSQYRSKFPGAFETIGKICASSKLWGIAKISVCHVIQHECELTIVGKRIGNVIDQGHTKVVIVEEANQDMVDNSEDLPSAEKHQKSCLVA
jgi:hypothetical protein